MQSLTIKDGHKRVYSIEATGILVSHFQNPSLPTEERFPFESIKRDKAYIVDRSPIFLIVTGILLILFVASLAGDPKQPDDVPTFSKIIWLTLTLIFACSYFLFAKRLYLLKTFRGKHIRFLVKRNDSEIAAFVEQTLTARDAYLKMKYGTPNQHLTYDSQYSNFAIMLRENIFTQTEYDARIDELNKLFNQTGPTQVYQSFSEN